ncbi:hypothetical protein BgiMline_013483 [Biomphalaria glabrata]|nr:hypothetical protein BgiMline_017287 [Biomphalaria glabrata]
MFLAFYWLASNCSSMCPSVAWPALAHLCALLLLSQHLLIYVPFCCLASTLLIYVPFCCLASTCSSMCPSVARPALAHLCALLLLGQHLLIYVPFCCSASTCSSMCSSVAWPASVPHQISCNDQCAISFQT